MPDPPPVTLADRLAKGELPGFVAVLADADTERVEAVGTTMVDGGEPMRRDTPFRLASITKPMVAAITMMLVDDGALSLSEPVDRLLPELADPRVLTALDGPLDETVPARRPITVEDVLTYRMGHGTIMEPYLPPWPIVRAGDELRLTLGEPHPPSPHTPDEWIRAFGTLPLMDQPGETWRYNVSGLVLGVLAARAAGLPLPELMRRRLFDPLGMATTGFSLPAAQAHRLPGYYMTDPESGRLERRDISPAEQWAHPPIFPSGASGLASTADDVLAFARLLLGRGAYHGTRLLSEGSVDLLTTNHLTPAQIAAGGAVLDGRGWGYGMAVTVAPDTVSSVPGRYGWDGGFGTSWFNDPATGRIGVLLTQVSDVLWNGTVDEFARHVLRTR
jgi:CubicO group peptidase (beta-lactamase class C family)